jgi:glycosyltransferase involved in cell wall biosynthesis
LHPRPKISGRPVIMLHVAFLFEFPTLNGGERSMLAVLNELKGDSTFRFSAIAPPDGELANELARLGISVHPLTIRHGDKKLPVDILHQQLRQTVQQIAPDVLHSNSLSMSRLAGQLDFPDQPELLKTGHLRDIIKLNARVISNLNANHALIAVSAATRDFHVGQGLDSNRCHVIYNGVDTEIFRPRRRELVRAEILPDLPQDAVVLLNVGQICLRKGQRQLAESLCQLLHDRQDVHLLIVGERHSAKAESIAFESAIQEAFTGIGKSSQLHRLGYRNDVHLLMNASDLLVHAAYQEPFGRTLLEAAASGLPIVATDVGGTAEMLRRDQDAILISQDSNSQYSQLATTALELLDNPDRRQQLADSAQQRIHDQFTIQTAAKRLGEFWASLRPA